MTVGVGDSVTKLVQRNQYLGQLGLREGPELRPPLETTLDLHYDDGDLNLDVGCVISSNVDGHARFRGVALVGLSLCEQPLNDWNAAVDKATELMKLVARVEKLSNGVVNVGMGCFDDNGNLDVPTTHTLLDLIEQSSPDDLYLESLVAKAEAGKYVSPNPALPDWGVNDINIWLVGQMALPGHVCIANENTEYSSDEEHGNPQQFNYEQFHAALEHWRKFLVLISREGKDQLIGFRFEAEFPH